MNFWDSTFGRVVRGAGDILTGGVVSVVTHEKPAVPMAVTSVLNPVGILVTQVASDPKGFVDKFGKEGQNFLDNPVEYVANKANETLDKVNKIMDNPTGYVCDQIGVEQPQFLKDFNENTNSMHLLNEMIAHQNGADQVSDLRNIQDIIETITKKYSELYGTVNLLFKDWTDLTLGNVLLMGIPGKVIAKEFPTLTIETLSDIRKNMPQLDRNSDPSMNLFDLWQAGGKKNLPDGVLDALGSPMNPMFNPGGVISINIANSLYKFIAGIGKQKMKQQIKEWQNYLEILTKACENALTLIHTYTSLILKEAEIYCSFAKEMNKNHTSSDKWTDLPIPPQAKSGFKNIEDVHDYIWAYQHKADEYLNEFLSDIPSFSSYLKGVFGLVQGYQDFIKNHQSKSSIEEFVKDFLNSEKAQDSIRNLEDNKDEIKKMLIIITYWASSHAEDIMPVDLTFLKGKHLID